MSKSMVECEWCKTEVDDGDEVWVEISSPGENPEPWSASFCGYEHASLWVAKPTPSSSDAYEEMGPLSTAITLTALGALVALFLLGLFVASRWTLAAIF